MTRYVLTNRRAGNLTDRAKKASNATVTKILEKISSARVISDHPPADQLARRVVVLEADSAAVKKLLPSLPAGAIIEREMHRNLPDLTPFRASSTLPVSSKSAFHLSVQIRGGGKKLRNATAMFFLSDRLGQINTVPVRADKNGNAFVPVPRHHVVSVVAVIPDWGFWVTIAEAPRNGATIDCASIPKAGPDGWGWWHRVMGVSAKAKARGAGIRVGVIDTGCGPNSNLSHVRRIGAFVDGKKLPGKRAAIDVAEHGTHTTGIIGARKKKPGDYEGIAPSCKLFHARVFKNVNEGPVQADLIHAIDALSHDYHCDLINMSLAGKGYSNAEADAIRAAAERGTLCVCSAGNESGAIAYPAAYPECVSVSAMGQLGWAPPGTYSASNRPQLPQRWDMIGRENLFLAAFSNYGPTLACTAPGVGIISTVPGRRGTDHARYMEMDGTSMASPAACGILAAILSKNPKYRKMPHDKRRVAFARSLLAKHCRSAGLNIEYEGKGLPHI